MWVKLKIGGDETNKVNVDVLIKWREIVVELFEGTFSVLLNEEEAPDGWRISFMVLIYKRRWKKVKLISIRGEVNGSVIVDAEAFIEHQVGDEKGGFWKDRKG